jgi:YbgC/YbaW family acyl-CoA thioester hydrolase
MPSTPFRARRRVEFADTDMAGLVHFANFFRFMESAEVEFLRSRGLSVAMEHEGERLGFPRVSASCDYLSPAHFDDQIDVEVSVSNVGRKSVTYAFEFFCGDVLLARGQVSAVCCRVVPGGIESIEMPGSIRKALESGA